MSYQLRKSLIVSYGHGAVVGDGVGGAGVADGDGVAVCPGVRDGSAVGVGATVGGTNCVGVGSRVSVGEAGGLGTTVRAVAVFVVVAVGVAICGGRVAVATTLWRVGVGVVPSPLSTSRVARPRT